jgi:DNA-binding CsgD family transcriptional regulator
MAMFTAVARKGPREIGELVATEKRAAYRASAPSAAWAAELLLFAGRASEAVEFAASIEEDEVGRRYWGLIPASLVQAVGLFAARECDDELARERFIRSLLTERPLPVTANYNRRHVALAHGDIAEHDGRISDALAAYAQALAECERSQYNDHTVMYLMSLIRQRRAELYLRGAAPDLVAAQAEFDALLPYWQKAKAAWYLERLRVWAEGHGLAFPLPEPSTAPAAHRQLTRRELEVARLVAQGLTNRQIGTRLTLSVRTAESHIEQIRAKLGFRTRSQIATWVTERYGATRSN